MKSTIKHNDVSKLSLGGILVALGVVYGDIGTSPLYVMKSIVQGNGGWKIYLKILFLDLYH